MNIIQDYNYTPTLAVSHEGLKGIQTSTNNDKTCQMIKRIHHTRCNIRASIQTNDKLMFKEDKLIVPNEMRAEMLKHMMLASDE